MVELQGCKMAHSYNNNVIAPEQHVFVLEKSVFETFDRSEGIDNGFHVLEVSFDFTQAFDRRFNSLLQFLRLCTGLGD